MSLALIADADLVARCREGDQEAWSELVNRFSRYVYAITSRVYRLSSHDAEDVFQDVFARTFEHLVERLRQHEGRYRRRAPAILRDGSAARRVV